MEKSNPIRILNIVPNMRAAGIETFIMNIYRNIDRTKVQFDFLVHSSKKEFYDDEIKMLGGKIYRLTYKDDKNFFKYIHDLNDFFEKHKEYQIVHGHMQSMMPIYLKIAKDKNVKVRIAHSHNNSFEKTTKGIILHFLSRFNIRYSNINLACSNAAGKYMFGEKEFKVIPNGIDVDKFKFKEDIRKEYRKKFNLKDNEIVVGTVGRFEKQKNHKFLIKIFRQIIKENKNYKLFLVGEGKLEKKIKTMVLNYNLQDKVIFLGIREDVNKLMQCFDVFLLPSLYEGLGIVLIEAQSAGLQCFTTKDKVAIETNITKNIQYISLNENEKIWAKKIINVEKNNRKLFDIGVIKEEFDIKKIADRMEEMYLNF